MLRGKNGRVREKFAAAAVMLLVAVAVCQILPGCGGSGPGTPLIPVEVFRLLYAGRENPSTPLTRSEVARLPNFYKDLAPAAAPAWADYPFGGFLLSHESVDFSDEVPHLSRVFQGVIQIGSAYFVDGKGLEAWLEARFRSRSQSVSTPAEPVPQPGSRQQDRSPTYDPDSWNAPDTPSSDPEVDLDRTRAQGNNNCYNYACNKRTDTFAQPGRRAEHSIDWDKFNCNEAARAAQADGLQPIACDQECTNGHKVMLFADAVDDPDQPGDDRDYHWYRQDAGGKWSHKPGQSKATNKDDSGNEITDPRTADTDSRRDFDGDGKHDAGYDYQFCGCFCVPQNVNIRTAHGTLLE